MHQEITKDYKYKFSVVIPIYNVEDYVEETILSVINQTIGFEENIQMILVNDGSPDNSEDICLRYKDKYPDNIIYVKQENRGVSAARNNGMNYIEGKYVNFLDSDDKWDLDAFEKVYDFFEKKHDEVDLVSCRMKFFEAREDYHILDYKFNKDRVIDIYEEYNCIQLHITSSFLKSDILDNYKFDTSLKFGEDAKFVSLVILNKQRYGVVKSINLNYRKRLNCSSAVQNKEKSIDWYIATPERFYKSLIDYSIQNFGNVIEYIQYLIMYDLQWRLKEESPKCLCNENMQQYKETIRNLICYLDDYIIYNQKRMTVEYKIYALSLKYNRDIRKEFIYNKGKLYFNNMYIYPIQSKHLLSINLLEVNEGYLTLEGKIRTILLREEYEIYIIDNKKNKFNLNYYSIDFDKKYSFDNVNVLDVYGFKISISIEDIKSIKFVISYKNRYTKPLYLSFGKFAKISANNKSYYHNGKYIIRANKNKINISSYNKSRHFKYEINYIRSLLKNKKYNIFGYRLLYYFIKLFIHKPIWIISDRTHAANDNGMYLFKYINSFKNNNVDVYFSISSDCDDYKKIKNYGKVLKINSLKYKIYFLMSKNIISSHADEWVINALGKDREYLKDLYKFNFVFLQHGITKNDLSKWLHKQNKNIKLFVTSVEDEYSSIVNGQYGYDDTTVKLTGFPRYDTLNCNKKKQIVIMPTWRKNIAKEPIAGTSRREYDDNFKNTQYYKFYNNLINDKRLLKVLKDKRYKAKFCIHPIFGKQAIDFISNDYIHVTTQLSDYQKEFNENSLLITDYSSVEFDFAYLNKPVIYTQFDRKTFYEGQIYEKGYFDYETHGFGPVCYDYETSISEIIDAIKNDCRIEQKYMNRINNFYKYNDKENCKRVYDEILKLK